MSNYFIGEDKKLFTVSKLDNFHNVLARQDLSCLPVYY